MEHGKSRRKFGRSTKQRQALIRSLAVGLIDNGKITTTEAKAKDLRPWIEKIITKAKKPTVPTMRALNGLFTNKTVAKLVKELAPKFADRNGGYTRIRYMPPRKSDGARMAIIEFVT